MNDRQQAKNLVDAYLDTAWSNYMQSIPFKYLIKKADSVVLKERLTGYQPVLAEYKGFYFSTIGNTDSSIYYQLEAISIYESIDSLAPKLMNAYFNLSETYMKGNFLDEAFAYGKKALKQAKANGSKLDLKYSYVLMGSINTRKASINKNPTDNYLYRKKAIKEYKKALGARKQEAILESYELSAVLGLSDNYREIHNLELEESHSSYLDSAEKYTNLAFTLVPDSMVTEKNIVRLQKSYIMQEREEFPEALQLINEAGSFFLHHGELFNIKQLYMTKADFYKKMGIMDSAFHYQKLYYNISDSIVDLETRKYTNQLETQYETAKKEKRIQALETQSKLQKAKNQLSLTVAIAIGVILIIVIYFLIQNRKKSKRLAEQNKIIQQSHKEIEDLIRESHHRIKNNLQVVSSLLKMQSKNAKSEETKANLLEAFNRVKTIAVLHQKLQGSQTFKQIQMQEFVSQLTEVIQGSVMSSDQDIQLSTDVDPILLSTDQSISIGLIINEVLTNSFKYAFAENKGSIILQLKEEGTDSIILKICDDGKGLPEDFDISQNPSLGYKIINSMTVKLKGKLDISGINGTCTSIHFKKTPIA
ncbi:histidine kinase dimerization/phosphoacceptor domain -containing protein [Owenweeksia hongkongensis]|uniref:tetratricopeptide repeat-containing sensor histidine kinase n=1 Tax=Owenweeksia hongkongensis TaxID=253245 RepID=UPI003A95AA0D